MTDAIGYVVYIETDDPDVVRTHSFSSLVEVSDKHVILETAKGRRKHDLAEYSDFGIFPLGPTNQVRGPEVNG